MNIKFMQKALSIANESGNDIPVGAVIVKDGKVLALSHNMKEASNDVSAHAEILAIRKASEKLNNWRLNGCDMYVTLEPCPMCLWAILQSRIDNLYFGSFDLLYGGISSSANCLLELSKSKISIKGGIMLEECDNLLNNYFESIR